MTLVDYANLLYKPLYDAFAVDSTLTPLAGSPVALRLVDRTKGVEVSQAGELNTIRPVAAVRVSELITQGIARSQLRFASVSMNGKTWRVEDYIIRPAPSGEDAGELWLVLIEA